MMMSGEPIEIPKYRSYKVLIRVKFTWIIAGWDSDKYIHIHKNSQLLVKFTYLHWLVYGLIIDGNFSIENLPFSKLLLISFLSFWYIKAAAFMPPVASKPIGIFGVATGIAARVVFFARRLCDWGFRPFK